MAREHGLPGIGCGRKYALHLPKKKIDDRYFIADETIDLSDLPQLSTTRQTTPRTIHNEQAGGTNRGRIVRIRPLRSGERSTAISFSASLAAAARRHGQSPSSPPIRLTDEDLQCYERQQPAKRLILFVVDTSDSMGDGPVTRMTAALGAALSLAEQAYLNRDRICLITFRDRAAQVIVPPTDSVTRLRQQLARLPVGGATPLASGLQKAVEILDQNRVKDPSANPLLVLISDGEATVSIDAGQDPKQEALTYAERIRRISLTPIVIDTMIGGQGPGFMPELAKTMGTRCHHIHNLQAGQVIDLIEQTKEGITR